MELSLDAAKRLFLNAKEDEGTCRSSTLFYYRYQIDRFLSWPDAPSIVSEVTPTTLRQWTASLRLENLKPGSIRTYQGAIWTWLRWLYTQDLAPADVTRKVKMVTVRDEQITRRTATDRMRRDLATVALSRAEHARRNAAVVELLWFTGARRGELAACDLSDWDRESGALRLGHTKMGRPRKVAVQREGRLALDRYILRERGEIPGPLFLARGGVRFTSNGMDKMLESLARSAGVTVTAHDFRRACAARLLRAGVPIDVVMSQLGHKSASMSLIYGADGREERSRTEIHALDSRLRASG